MVCVLNLSDDIVRVSPAVSTRASFLQSTLLLLALPSYAFGKKRSNRNRDAAKCVGLGCKRKMKWCENCALLLIPDVTNLVFSWLRKSSLHFLSWFRKRQKSNDVFAMVYVRVILYIQANLDRHSKNTFYMSRDWLISKFYKGIFIYLSLSFSHCVDTHLELFRRKSACQV